MYCSINLNSISQKINIYWIEKKAEENLEKGRERKKGKVKSKKLAQEKNDEWQRADYFGGGGGETYSETNFEVNSFSSSISLLQKKFFLIFFAFSQRNFFFFFFSFFFYLCNK